MNFNLLWICLSSLLLFSKSGERKISAEDTLYWQGQQKYMVNPKDFFGKFPEELESFIVMFQNKEDFIKVGLYKSSNFIFYGPPGTGKTYIASVFAQRLNADFMYVQGTELIDMWQGAGIRKPTELFEKARRHRDDVNKPVVMFIDEIDTVVGSRDNPNMHEGTLQLLGSLLKEIGAEVNNNIFVIIATNRKDNLDAALVRSGRFDHHVYFDLPSQQERKEFLLFLIASYRSMFHSSIDWDLIARNTHGYTYADLRKCIDDLKREHVLSKLQKRNCAEQICQNDILRLFPSLVKPVSQLSDIALMQTVDSCMQQEIIFPEQATESDQSIIGSWFSSLSCLVAKILSPSSITKYVSGRK